MTKTISMLWIALIALTATTVAATEPTAPPSKCPSLEGEWSGDFDGAYSGTWRASFTQTRDEVSAQAYVTLDGGVTSESEGTAGIKCQGRQTAVAGSGSVKNKSGSFSGISDTKGRRLSGTWWSGDLAGTWRGARVAP
jgi:hypothetical protein